MKFPHSLWLSGFVLLTGCAQPKGADCDPAEQIGVRGAEWKLCPLSALEGRRGGAKLTGLGLKRTLTLSELRAALDKNPVQMRAAYFAAGSGRGTWAEPSAVSPEQAISQLTGQQKSATSETMTWTKRNARQVMQAKALGRVLDPSQSPPTFTNSLRYGVLGVVREHQAWLDAQAVRDEKRGFICGLQVQGTPAQVLAFAKAVGATGFTFDRAELFNSLRAADPPDLKERLKQVPGTLSDAELLKLGQQALLDFKP